jgi:hypothetical protein
MGPQHTKTDPPKKTRIIFFLDVNPSQRKAVQNFAKATKKNNRLCRILPSNYNEEL